MSDRVVVPPTIPGTQTPPSAPGVPTTVPVPPRVPSPQPVTAPPAVVAPTAPAAPNPTVATPTKTKNTGGTPGQVSVRITPLDRSNPHDAFGADDLMSAIGERHQASSRIDPYWDRLWTSGSSVSWTSYNSASHQVAAGLGSLPKALRMEESQAWECLLSSQNFTPFIRFMSVLGAWRTMTGEQAEAMSGSLGANDIRSKMMAAAFRVGLIEYGSVALGLKASAGSNRGVLIRPTNNRAIDRVLDHLTYPEWVAFTGGVGWEQGGQFDRHNILATELGLRMAEFTDTAFVLGEKMSTYDLLGGSGIGRDFMTGDTRSADVTVVRPDGLRVAVELTASTGQSFRSKVEKWAKFLNERPLADSGLSVIFVVAPPHTPQAAEIRSDVYKTVASAVRMFPGTAAESVANRMGVVTWTEWFPGRHLVSPRFLSMKVDMPTGKQGTEGLWSEVDLLDAKVYPYTPRRPELNAILTNGHALWSVPHWLRDPSKAPELWPYLYEKARAADAPTPPPIKPERTKGYVPGTARGVAEDYRPTKRLRPYM